MACARVSPDVDDGQPGPASHLETPESVKTGAGVGVSSNVWLRDNALDAHRRSQTQFLTACRALPIVVPDVPERFPADSLAHLTRRQYEAKSCTRGKRAISWLS